MTFLLTLLVLVLCLGLMAAGLLLKKKSLRRGCSVNPDDCACAKEGKSPQDCDKDTAKS